MENVLFKISFPAEFHAQTAAEAAVRLHPLVKDRLQRISRIVITTHESAIRIISKVGPLANPADRDHCLQYMTAVPLIFGDLVAEHYEDAFHAAHLLIDRLREKMEIVEEPRYSREYLEADKRSIANALKCSSTTAAAPARSPWSTRSAIAAGAPKAFRCCRRSSRPTWPRASRRSAAKGSSTCAATRRHWKPRR